MLTFDDIIFSAYKICAHTVPLLLFCWQLKRRKLFSVRIIAAVAFCIGIEILSMFVSFKSLFWLHCLYNIAVFLIFSLLFWLACAEKYIVVLFCCIAGKCVMHIAEYLNQMLFLAIDGPNTYISIIISFIVYVVSYFVFAKRIKSEECYGIDNIKIILVGLLIIAACDVVIMDFNDANVDNSVRLVVYLMVLIVCVLVMCMLFGLLTESRITREAETIKQLRVKEREQYETTKEAIKLISIKHHDIKAMLESHRGQFSDEEINKINQSIELYNVSFNTGNKTLDVVLTEKFISCKHLNIRLEYLVNGAPLAFMSDMDVYSLFLNALNNAIESVQKLDDEDKRVIWLKTYLRGNLLCIQVRNYFEGDIEIKSNNLISTTKSDKKYHGFGLQSMKMIAEKYGARMSVNASDKMFSLAFVFVVPDAPPALN